jgi:hypothetical protein
LLHIHILRYQINAEPFMIQERKMDSMAGQAFLQLPKVMPEDVSA